MTQNQEVQRALDWISLFTILSMSMVSILLVIHNFYQGIPEHATDFSLKPTRGADNRVLSDPYR